MMGILTVGGESLKAHTVSAIQVLGLSPVNNSLLFAIGFVLVFWAIAYFLFKKQWLIKV